MCRSDKVAQEVKAVALQAWGAEFHPQTSHKGGRRGSLHTANSVFTGRREPLHTANSVCMGRRGPLHTANSVRTGRRGPLHVIPNSVWTRRRGPLHTTPNCVCWWDVLPSQGTMIFLWSGAKVVSISQVKKQAWKELTWLGRRVAFIVEGVHLQAIYVYLILAS